MRQLSEKKKLSEGVSLKKRARAWRLWETIRQLSGGVAAARGHCPTRVARRLVDEEGAAAAWSSWRRIKSVALERAPEASGGGGWGAWRRAAWCPDGSSGRRDSARHGVPLVAVAGGVVHIAALLG